MEEFDDHLVLFSCYLILYATEIEPTIAESQTKFETRKIIYDLIRRGLKCYISRYSLLNLVTSTRSNLIYSNRISFAAVKLLVECGATTDASTLNTPLHIAMSLPFVSSDEEPERLNIAKYLLDEAKAHIDSRNEDGHTPMDCCIIDNVAKHICPLKYMTLKCFAAQSLRKFNLSYRHMGLSHTMETFVDTHWHNGKGLRTFCRNFYSNNFLWNFLFCILNKFFLLFEITILVSLISLIWFMLKFLSLCFIWSSVWFIWFFKWINFSNSSNFIKFK